MIRPLATPLKLIPLALLLGVSSALAFDTSKLGQWGSLGLDDLASIIAKSARLQEEISEVLSEGNKKQEDVTCVGMRFPGQWKHLGGLRVSPYACDFGAMWLQIRATVRITDRRGQSFETITDKAMNNATNVSEVGVKGAGEAGAVGARPAVINAIVDALHHRVGLRHIDMPATPRRVWEMLSGIH